MRWSCNPLLSLAAAVLLALCLVMPARTEGQAVEKGNAKALPPGRTRSKISEEDFKTLIRLELEAGARSDARKAPTAEALNGPPLNDREKLLQVMARMSFGPRPGEVDRILKEEGGWKAWATKQLDPAKIDDSAHEADIAKRFPWTKMSLQDIRKNYPIDRGNESNRQLRKELPESVVYRALSSNRQFNEVICEFWRNHFCINQPSTGAPMRSWTAVRYEEDVIRKHAFGKFKNMLFASATHPAMLEFLDNFISRANAWNENYARELMELHTLGAERYYNEYDGLELRKVLTGWTFNRDMEFNFNANWHQPGPKNVLRTQIPAGREGGEQAIYMLATHKYTAEFIATKLCKYLVNDNPPPALVQKVAGVFTRTEGDLPKVYEAIIFSPEFMDRANYRAKFRTPFEFVVASARATDAQIDDAGDACYELAKMGMQVYNCPDPTGYYDRAEAWLDSGVLTSRWDYAWDLCRGGVKGVKPNPAVFAKYKAMSPDDRYKNAVKEFIGDDIGDKTRQALKAAADEGDIETMVAILVGSPSFQQQ